VPSGSDALLRNPVHETHELEALLSCRVPATVPTRATFLVNYPEFNKASADLVDAKLAEAAYQVRSEVFPSAQVVEYQVMLEAAVLLMKSPYGRQMRLEAAEQFMVWEEELKRRRRRAVIGLRNT